MEKKTALVMSGGGSKGAYEVGCIRALKELGYQFDIVCGTSIGALNGLLVAQNDYELLYDLWENMDVSTIMKEPLNFELSLDSLMSQKNMIMPFFKSYINEKGADITPLLEKIHSLFYPEHLKESGITYGLVTVGFPSLKPLEVTNHEMKEEEVVEYAIASASCFPAFPIHKINGNGYIDGGYYDNLPISMALNLGADQVIAIELNREVTHPQFLNRPNIMLIRPSWHLGGFLDFDREALDRRIHLGYLDTMKMHHRFKGYRYAFNLFDETEEKIERLYKQILNYENMINRPIRSKVVSTSMTPITDLFNENSYKEQLSMEDYLILTLENAMAFYEFSYDQVYDYKTVNEKLYKLFLKSYHTNSDIYTHKFTDITPARYKEYFKGFSKKEIVSYFYHMIKSGNDIEFALSNTVLQNSFLKEYLCALYIAFLK